MMSFFSRLFGSGSSTATVEPTVTESFTPSAEDFRQTEEFTADSPALRPKQTPAPAPPNRFALPEEPALIREFLDRDHKAQGYHDALNFPQAQRRDLQMSALRNEFRECLRGHTLSIEGYIRKTSQVIAGLDPSGDACHVTKLQGFLTEAEAMRTAVADELVQLELNQGRGALAINAYSLGFHEGLSDLIEGRETGLDQDFTSQPLG